MKKSIRNIACLLLASITAFSFVGCGKGGSSSSSSDSSFDSSSGISGSDSSSSNDSTSEPGSETSRYNPETTPFVMSTETLDGNFNPFFATSAPDVNVAAQTQIGMLSTNAAGEMICGQNEPTVALDYKVTMYNEAGGIVTSTAPAEGEVKSTAYEFVIKNGMKFSDGNDLTLEDVLFNLYVYLDPAYTGSATLYSTKIQGLYNYRRQEKGNVEGDIDQTIFYNQAEDRIYDIIYLMTPESTDDENIIGSSADIKKDIVKAQEIFRKDLDTDWSDNAGTLESYKEKYNFTEVWEVFLFVEGIVKVSTEQNTNGAYVPMTDANGKYITNLDEASPNYNADIRSAIEAGIGNKTGTAKEEAMKQTAIQYVYDAYATDSDTEPRIEPEVLMYWTTGDHVADEFAAQARDEYFKNLKEDGKLLVDHIEGISYYNTQNKEFTGGKMGSTLDPMGHDVLKIVIDNVDPKAIYNFSFTVAPMHYYGNGKAGTDYENYATDSVNLYPDIARGEQYNFGVAFNDKTFFDTVLRDTDKNGLPMGAGAYKASSSNKKDTPNRTNFYKDNRVYFERNTEFDTIGTGLCEAKIKYMEFKVMSADMIIGSLARDEIHYGQPNATIENASEVSSNKKLTSVSAKTNGYGYVGVNPKFVSDINVRRIIMRTMDLNYPKAYYGNKAQTIYRPMSASSAYYPKYTEGEADMAGTPVGVYEGGAYDASDTSGSLVPYKQLVMDENGWTQEILNQNPQYRDDLEDQMIEMIKADLTAAGWAGQDGTVWTHEDHDPLDYVFTIAGDTTDHPAYAMFENAAALLNKCGFKITVQRDITALRKLTEGKLTVWAAAWSSTIDPDMYQVYHKDSTATSIKNWGYDAIMKGDVSIYGYEQECINNLSELIEQGRETIDPESRFYTYCQALDYVMELAIELPTYQREDLYVFNANILDSTTLNTNVEGYEGVLDRIWELNFKK